MQDFETLFSPDTKLYSTAKLHLDPQWVEAAALPGLQPVGAIKFRAIPTMQPAHIHTES